MGTTSCCARQARSAGEPPHDRLVEPQPVTRGLVLGELVDHVAEQLGCWVVVEREGGVLVHGAATTKPPEALVSTVVTKRCDALRRSVVWSRSPDRHVRGVLEELPVQTSELGEGLTAWFVGASVDDATLSALRDAALGWTEPVLDPFVHDLVHPVGPARRGHAPRARLVVVQHDGSAAALSQRVAAATAGTGARVHAHHDGVIVAIDPDVEVSSVLARLRGACSSVVAGTAVVPEGASSWAETAALAAACAVAARELEITVGDAADPKVGAELVVREAYEAARELARTMPGAPLGRLREHDARTTADLERTLAAWCAASFDVNAAAAAMHVHPNTLRYRLKRAAEVSGLDLKRPRQLLAVQLLLVT